MASLQNLRVAMRSLGRSPRFTLAAVVTLALGIGANAAIFAIVDRLVLHPFPAIDAPQRVVWLFESAGTTDLDRDSVVAANFADYRAQARSFEAAGALALAELTLTGGGDPERVGGQRVTAGYFAVLGLRPALGRFFTAEEERPGAPEVVVVGHGLWQRRFGGDPALVGREIEINGRATTVVGILPRDFVFPRAPDLVVPLRLDAAAWQDRREPAFAGFARLAPGVSLAAAAAELDVVAARLEQQHPETNRGLRVAPVPLGQVFSTRGPMLALLAGVGFLLLIACANVANLSLARGVARRRELAVRAALGATRGRLAAALLLESALLAVAGAALGLVVAAAAVDLLVAALPRGFADRIPIIRQVAIGGDVLGFSVALAGVTTLLVGIVPALRGSRVDLAAALKEGGGVSAGGRRRLMGALVVGQLALAMVLLAGSSAMLRSFLVTTARPLGFRADGVATLRLPLEARHPDPAARRRFVDALLERTAGLPGAGPVAAMTAVPSTINATVPFTVAGRPPPAREDMPHAHLVAVTPDAFRALELPLLRGRPFQTTDNRRLSADDSQKLIIVSAMLSAQLFPDGDALGRQLQFPDGSTAEIIGIAGDVTDPRPRAAATGTLYVPYDGSDSELVLAVRAADPAALGAMARAAVHELDPRQVVEAQRPLEQLLSERTANQRLGLWIVGVTTALALALAALGLYALVAYAASQRTRELGIRVALGARRGALLATVLRGALLLVALGVGAGVALSLPLVRLLGAVFSLDPAAGSTLAVLAAGAALALVAAFAGLLPARRAARVDPMIALRAE